MPGFARRLATSCAVDGGLLAATRDAPASRVVSRQRTRPLAARGEGGGRKMVSREKLQDSIEAWARVFELPTIPVLEDTKTETEAKSKSCQGTASSLGSTWRFV